MPSSEGGKPKRETDLYPPIRDYLTEQGYTVRGEVKGCDVTAVKGDDLIVVELKRSLSLDLLLQATQRQRITNSVYVAVPHQDSMGRNKRWRHIRHLLRRLELGLILVSFRVKPPQVEVVFHPGPLQRRKETKKRRAIIEEMAQRSGDATPGGSTRTKIMTAYREMAIHIARCLDRLGPSSPKVLRENGTGPKTTSILYDNHYGWFNRVDRGLYELSPNGKAALEEYRKKE